MSWQLQEVEVPPHVLPLLLLLLVVVVKRREQGELSPRCQRGSTKISPLQPRLSALAGKRGLLGNNFLSDFAFNSINSCLVRRG